MPSLLSIRSIGVTPYTTVVDWLVWRGRDGSAPRQGHRELDAELVEGLREGYSGLEATDAAIIERALNGYLLLRILDGKRSTWLAGGNPPAGRLRRSRC
jgi:hypothetical protein